MKSVCLAMPTSRPISPATHLSVVQTVVAAMQQGVDLTYLQSDGCPLVEVARSKVVWKFLNQITAQKLFFVDSDMAWEPDAFFKILGLSEDRHILGACYTTRAEPPQFKYVLESSVSINGLLAVRSMGLGFTCIDRSVLEELTIHAPKVRWGNLQMPMIFRVSVEDGELVGEDANFFGDCRALGHLVWCDPSIRLGHVGDKVYWGRLADHLSPKPSPSCPFASQA